MSTLSEVVYAITRRLKGNPGVPLTPQEVAVLEVAATRDASTVYAASHSPIAPDTYAVQSLLASTATETPTEPLVFDRAVEIVSFYVSLVDLNDASKPAAKIDDLQVSMKVDGNNALTSGRGSANGSANASGDWVSLGAIDVRAPRLFRLPLMGTTPRLDFKFRPVRGANVYNSTRIDVAAFVRDIG